MKVKIVRAEETMELGSAGELKRIAVYRYTLDALGPFEIRVSIIDDKPEIIRKAIEEKIRTVAGLQEI